MVDTGKVQGYVTSITWTQKKLAELKKVYAQAVEAKQERFIFENQDLLTNYAKYLIEWLDGQFKQGAKK